MYVYKVPDLLVPSSKKIIIKYVQMLFHVERAYFRCLDELFRWFRWFRSGGFGRFGGSGGFVPVVSFRRSGFYHMPILGSQAGKG